MQIQSGTGVLKKLGARNYSADSFSGSVSILMSSKCKGNRVKGDTKIPATISKATGKITKYSAMVKV